MRKFSTSLLFLALVFGAFATSTTTFDETAITEIYSSDADVDKDITVNLDGTTVGAASATKQYLFAYESTGATLHIKELTVDQTVDPITVTQDDPAVYITDEADPVATPAFSWEIGTPDDYKVLTGNGLYCLITLEYDGTTVATDKYTVYAYAWDPATLTGDITGTMLREADAAVQASGTAGGALALANAWYAADTFWVTVVIQTKSTADAYSDTGVAVVGLDVSTSTYAAATGEFENTIAGAAISAVGSSTSKAQGACADSTCSTFVVVFTDLTGYYVQDLADTSADATNEDATEITDTASVDGDTVSAYTLAGVVNLSDGPAVILGKSSASTGDTTITYGVGIYMDGEIKYDIDLDLEDGTVILTTSVYWTGVANGNTEPSIILMYTTASADHYHYIVATSSKVKANFAIGTFDNPPIFYVDSGENAQLWCAWAEGTSTAATSIKVAPLASNLLTSAIAFVSMIVMTLFMF